MTNALEPVALEVVDREADTPPRVGWDPLAGTRTSDDPPLDVLTTGTVFFDIIFTQLPRVPEPGEELWSGGLGSCPGGIANLSTALARLGLRTGLIAGFGDDAYADWLVETLAGQEHIDLCDSPRFERFHTALTVAMTVGGDRAMVTHGHPLPEPLATRILTAPRARAAVVDLGGETSWFAELASRGTLLFADIGFDESGRWGAADLEPLRHCHGFSPNAVEAMGYTRTDTASAAVRELAKLVPLAIVTDGANGAYAIDQATGEEAFCPAVAVEAVDATGAGDVFASAMVLGSLAGWPLEHRLRFAALCSSLAVQQFGGSLAAPGWGDIADWWHGTNTRAKQGDLRAEYVRRDYAFLDEVVPQCQVEGVRRAQATFATHADMAIHPDPAP